MLFSLTADDTLFPTSPLLKTHEEWSIGYFHLPYRPLFISLQQWGGRKSVSSAVREKGLLGFGRSREIGAPCLRFS